MAKVMKNTRVSFALSNHLKKFLQEKAELHDLSLSEYIRFQLTIATHYRRNRTSCLLDGDDDD